LEGPPQRSRIVEVALAHVDAECGQVRERIRVSRNENQPARLHRLENELCGTPAELARGAGDQKPGGECSRSSVVHAAFPKVEDPIGESIRQKRAQVGVVRRLGGVIILGPAVNPFMEKPQPRGYHCLFATRCIVGRSTIMDEKRLNGLAVGFLAASILAAVSGTALAQSGALEEVVVTARRRAESFQDVPVTITAFGEEDIQAAGIERPQDFISLTPNVTLVETQNQGTSFITIRGISQARNSEPSVAVLVDGVLMSNPAQFTQELFDVQQIEVLKGAQGAVYGRNAIGGAIVITTREPGDEFEGRARLGYDDGPGVTAQIMGSGPIGDSETLKYHAALSHYDTDGWIEN